MLETLTLLVAAHLLGDFVFQTDAMVRRKRRPAVLLLHVAVVAATTAALLGAASARAWVVVGIVFVSHVLFDVVKLALPARVGGGRAAFFVDQALHLAVAAGLAAAAPELLGASWWRGLWPASADGDYLFAVTLAGGGALTVFAGGRVIGLMLAPLADRLDAADREGGLPHGGRLIGQLERLLVLILVVAGQPGAIGFVVATKSILRFGEIKDSGNRRLTEYIIVGTFASFSWGLFAAILTERAAGLW